jgi:hypothetical protein
MNNITRTWLAATAIGAVSIGSASAMPLNHLSPALGASDVQNVRVVCNQNGQCFNTVRTVRSGRRTYAPRDQAAPQYYAAPQYGYAAPQYGYFDEPRIGFGIGPFGFRVW